MLSKLFFTTIVFLSFSFFAQPDVKIDKKYYQITYSQKLKQPLTVDYGIRTRECTATRSGMEFYAEKGVITSSNADYANNEWDKGHMAPAAERVWATKDSIIVHIDVIFDTNPAKTPGGAAIPKAFRKTITFYSTGKKVVYEFPNVPPTQPLPKYLIKGKL
jgi:hypothetical protein